MNLVLITVLLVVTIFGFFLITGWFTFLMPPIVPLTEVPYDAEIKYTYGACNPAWDRTNILIKANGSGIYESGTGMPTNGSNFSKEHFKKKFTLTNQELLELINKIRQNEFYNLRDIYIDDTFQDGSCSSISIKANNITKQVAISNAKPPEFYSKLERIISSLAERKTK